MSTGTATYNLGDGTDLRKLRDLRKLASIASVIGLQEAGDRWTMLEDFLEEAGWSAYHSRAAGAASVPILFDPRVWKLCRLRTIIAVTAAWVGAGAGPAHAKARAINVVVLKHRRTRRRRRHLCTHFIASATRRGAAYEARRDNYRAHAAVLSRVIRAGRPPVVLADFNAVPTSPLLEPIRATGITGWTQQPTHGTRSIDHVLGLEGRRRTIRLSSDHKAVVVTEQENPQ